MSDAVVGGAPYRRLSGLLLGGVLLGAMAVAVRAEHRPRWEVGLGGFFVDMADYRGSDQRQAQFLPFPYLVYRGERIKADRDGVRGLLFDSTQLQLDLSGSGALAVSSDNNLAREDMPDLDFLVEFGASLKWYFTPASVPSAGWHLALPLRAVFSTDFAALEHRGWVFNPNLAYIRAVEIGGIRPARLQISAGPVFSDRRFNDYIYGVAPEFATATRPAYTAAGGYGGARLTVSLSHDLGERLQLATFVRYDDLHGTVYDDSPLLRRRDSAMVGIALSWVFGQSDEYVLHDGEMGRIPASIN